MRDLRPTETQILVQSVQPHGPGISGRNGAGGAGKTKASSSSAAASGTFVGTLVDQGLQPDATPIHASTVGALIDGEYS